jgi:chaperonin GroEL
MSTTIKYTSEARNELLAGVEAIAKAVRVTLGPSGRNVLIRNAGSTRPFATKDGVTVAAQIKSDVFIEQQAIEAFQEIANESDNNAGDGTTTATLLGEAIFKGGIDLSTKVNLIDVKRGIDKATKHIVKRLIELSVPCKDNNDQLREVAMISSNHDKEIADVVLDAFNVSGDQGVVNIKRSRTNDTYLTTVEGMHLGAGFMNPVFVNDYANDLVDFENPYVYSTNERITTATPNFSKIIETSRAEKHPILIICKDIDVNLAGLLASNISKGLQICIVKAPGHGVQMDDELRDLGIVLGKPPFLENEGVQFNDVPEDEIMDYIPQSESIMVSKHTTSVKGPKGLSDDHYFEIEEKKLARIDFLRKELEKQITSYEKQQLQSRISRLSNGIAYIHIGAVTDIEFEEKQHRIQDALYGIKSASEEGIVPGGGTALLYISQEEMLTGNPDTRMGSKIVFKAIREPFIQILKNVGIVLDDNQLDSYVKNWNYGIDARTGKPCKDMIKAGIIDPVKVTRVALENAASIAGMLLTTDCVIVDEDAYSKTQPQPEY